MQLSGIEAFKVYGDRIMATTTLTFFVVGLLLSGASLTLIEILRFASGFSILTFLLTTLYACVYLPFKLQRAI